VPSTKPGPRSTEIKAVPTGGGLTPTTTPKSTTGIKGFDTMTGGGVPRSRTTLVVGGPGSGKTIFALQFLAEGVKSGEPGIFVAFEEAADRIIANAQGFGWTSSRLGRAKSSSSMPSRLRTSYSSATSTSVA
jgi:KaiC/GvpD/RAD55 family RecA-like ATPase